MICEEVFMREVEGCERMLYRISRTLLRSEADCCDAVQEALMKGSIETELMKIDSAPISRGFSSMSAITLAANAPESS